MIEIRLHSGLTLIFHAGANRGLEIGVDTHTKNHAPRFYNVRSEDIEVLHAETLIAQKNITRGFISDPRP